MNQRFWYRVSDSIAEQDLVLVNVLAKHGCRLVYGSSNKHWSSLRDIAVAADSDNETSSFSDLPGYSFASDSLVDAMAAQHCSAVEWFLTSADGSQPLDDLEPLSIRLPLDVANQSRLQQRIRLLRNCVYTNTKIGIGMTMAYLLENLEAIWTLDIDFITAISPLAVLAESHHASHWVKDSVVEQLQRLVSAKHKVGRERLAIVLQAPLRSGYDAAAYLAMGADSIVLNAWEGTKTVSDGTNSVDSFATSFLGAAAQQHLSASNLLVAEQRVQVFFNEVNDYQTYMNSKQLFP